MFGKKSPHWLRSLLAAVGLAAVAGCSHTDPLASPAKSDGSAQGTASGGLADCELWDVSTIQGARVGYGVTTIRHASEDGHDVLKVDQDMHLAIERFGQTTKYDVHYSESETPSGAFLGFQSEIHQGPTPLQTSGRVKDHRLQLAVVNQGQRQQATIDWPADCGGMLEPELALLRHPMKPGEHRVVRHLGFDNQIAEMQMDAAKEEDVSLLAGKFRLLKIDTLDRMPNGQTLKGAFWTTASGETLKGWIEPMNMESFRVSKDVATAKTELAKLDLGTESMVKLAGPLPHGHQSHRARYRVRLDGGDPLTSFIAGPSQQVKRIDDHTAEVTVYAIRPGQKDGNPEAAADPPADADRQANSFIQSDDATIVAHAREAAGAEQDPWRMALALEQYVYKAVTKKGYSQAFATAAEVARSGEGDCKAHATYLAALARARGLPARVAMGLVYLPKEQAFAFHMWTEVYLDQRWIPLDAIMAQGGTGGGYLKLGHSSLSGVAAYSAFLPVMQVIGRLHVDVLDAE